LFRYPTIAGLAEYLTREPGAGAGAFQQIHHRVRKQRQLISESADIAIIGMAGRFPGAANVDEFWRNLCGGEESLSFFTHEELLERGLNPDLLKDPEYVRAGAVLEDIDLFDAPFFGFSPREAELTDPQHRLLLECAWESLEHAGYSSENSEAHIGVYAGTAMNSYILKNLVCNPDVMRSADDFQLAIGNDKDYIATRISHHLNLRGPAINVGTACSTSLVAVHLACRSLLNGQCDMALAGGVSVKVTQDKGYVYREGGILSSDGHCRTFDADAKGTVLNASGMGMVVLKRLDEALAYRDCVHAVIRGSAVNNDGAAKVGYTAPSVEGQAEVIAEAQAVAGIDPETITYVEAHGTGTPVGDPIEMTALTRAFRAGTRKSGFCAIGSVKTNIGHLDAAAGIAALLKTVLALKHGMIPPSLNFTQPNPRIDFDNSPFFVNTELSQWKTDSAVPRRAGVSAFGIGGTNAHMVLEEVREVRNEKSLPTPRLIVLSAKTASALEQMTKNLGEHLGQHSDIWICQMRPTPCNSDERHSDTGGFSCVRTWAKLCRP